MPLFDFGSNKRERRALEAEARGQEAQVTLLRSQAAAALEQALIRGEQQRQTVERFRTGIVPLTLDLLRKTQIGYDQGASSYLEVLDAQRTTRQVQTEYLQALIGVRTAAVQLESVQGGVILPSSVSLQSTGPVSAPNSSTTSSTITPIPGTPPAGATPLPVSPQEGR